MKKAIILFLLLVSCKQEKPGIYLVDKPQFEALIEKEYLVLDVRTPKEFTSGAIENAVNMDYNAPDFRQKIDSLPKDKPVLVYCGSGVRSALAVKVMDSLGFQTVYDLKGGYLKWLGY